MKVRFWKHNPPYSERFIEIEGFGFACLDRCSWSSRKLSTCDLHECDANWQPLEKTETPKVREWVRGNERWRWDGNGMTYTNESGSSWKTKETPETLLIGLNWSSTGCWSEVHPGTSTPICDSLRGSKATENAPLVPPLVKVREWVSDVPAWRSNRWRQDGDGPMMYLSDYGQWFDLDWDADTMGVRTPRPYEVHPGTRIPIGQPLPSPTCDVVPANEAKPTAEKTELDEYIEWLETQEPQPDKLSIACSMITNGLREANRRIDNIERRLGIKG